MSSKLEWGEELVVGLTATVTKGRMEALKQEEGYKQLWDQAVGRESPRAQEQNALLTMAGRQPENARKSQSQWSGQNHACEIGRLPASETTILEKVTGSVFLMPLRLPGTLTLLHGESVFRTEAMRQQTN